MESSHDRWSEQIHRYDVPHLRLRQVAALVKQAGARDVIDIGCGPGQLRRLLGEVGYIGCDFVEPPETPDFEFHRCDFNKGEFPEGVRADAVVCSGILEYIEQLPSFLEKLVPLVRPGGHLVATYFNMNHFSRIWTMLRGKTPPFHPDWRGFHSPAEVRLMLERHGWNVEKLVPSGQGLWESRSVGSTTESPATVDPARAWSPLLSHQIIYVARVASTHDGA